jgi:hypothetical protein
LRRAIRPAGAASYNLPMHLDADRDSTFTLYRKGI